MPKKRNPFQPRQQEKKEDHRMIGGYFPLHIADRLRLLSIYYEESVQGTLQAIIENWISENADKTDDVILEDLSARACSEWRRRTGGRKAGKKEKEEYVKEMGSILKRRKMPEQYIDALLKALKAKMEDDS